VSVVWAILYLTAETMTHHTNEETFNSAALGWYKKKQIAHAINSVYLLYMYVTTLTYRLAQKISHYQITTTRIAASNTASDDVTN